MRDAEELVEGREELGGRRLAVLAPVALGEDVLGGDVVERLSVERVGVCGRRPRGYGGDGEESDGSE